MFYCFWVFVFLTETKAQDESKLTAWEFTNISQAAALEFCLALNPEAYLLPDGRITAPREETTA